MINASLKYTSGEYCNTDAIRKTISYIYRLESKNPLPVRFYGLTDIGGYPPAYDKIIQQFQNVRTEQHNVLYKKILHMVISFPCLFEESYGRYFYFADAIAKVFALEYPVCYAYHTKNKSTEKKHSHFHYIISTSSYIPDYPPLDDDNIQIYINKMQEIASSYNILLQIQQ